MKFGAHISTKKPFSDAITRATDLGCDCMQIFANAPQRWNPTFVPEEEIIRFNQLNEESNIQPIIIHSIYLVNLASNNPFFLKASISSLVNDMTKSYKIGGFGVNTHLGSTLGGDSKKALEKTVSVIKEVLNQSQSNQHFIIENSAGAGNVIGDTLEEIGQIVKEVGSERVRVLIDTAHAFASGYDLKTNRGLNSFIDQFEREIGLDRLIGFHLNDSKALLGSHRDRHADIGKGELGLDAFKNLINHQKLKDLIGILETPQDEISWEEQLSLLRKMEEK